MQVTLTKELIDSGSVSEHPVLSYWYDMDEVLEVYVTLTGRPIRDDYSVYGSPVWWVIEDIEIETIEINGDLYTAEQFDKIATKEVSAYIDELVDNIEHELTDWE
jgi:hypothetical protein